MLSMVGVRRSNLPESITFFDVFQQFERSTLDAGLPVTLGKKKGSESQEIVKILIELRGGFFVRGLITHTFLRRVFNDRAC